MMIRHTRRCNWTTKPYQPTAQQRTQARSQAHDAHVQSAATCPMCGAPILACRCADNLTPDKLDADYCARYHESTAILKMRTL